MIFWTLFLLIFSLGSSKINKSFSKMGAETKKYKLDKFKDRISKYKEEDIVANSIILFILVLSILIITYIYLIAAIKVDIFLYPTLVMIALVTIPWLRMKLPQKLEDMSHEELLEYELSISKPVKTTLWNFIRRIINVSYYSYMFYILVFFIEK